jgi:hypothetical protein
LVYLVFYGKDQELYPVTDQVPPGAQPSPRIVRTLVLCGGYLAVNDDIDSREAQPGADPVSEWRSGPCAADVPAGIPERGAVGR